MNALTTLITHLGRGGRWQYYWIKGPQKKNTLWFPVGVIPPTPADTADIYFSVNPVVRAKGAHARGKKLDIAAVNGLFGDFDLDKCGDATAGAALKRLESCRYPPSAAVLTGGGLHAYWLLRQPFVIRTDQERGLLSSILKHWVVLMGADPGAADLARVLRLPGTRNFKYKPPAAVAFALAAFDRQYAFHELLGALPPETGAAAKKKKPLKHPPPALSNSVADTRRALSGLAAWRRSDYRAWLEVGMSLRSLGEQGLALWDDWSRGCPEKYHPEACAEKWKSIDADGITLASLFHWARHDRGEV